MADVLVATQAVQARTKIKLGIALGLTGAVFSALAVVLAVPKTATIKINNAPNVFRTPLKPGPSAVLGRLNVTVTGSPVQINSLTVQIVTTAIPITTVAEPYRLMVYVCDGGTGYGYNGYGYSGGCSITTLTSHVVISQTSNASFTQFMFPPNFTVPPSAIVWIDGIANVQMPVTRNGTLRFGAYSIVASSTARTFTKNVSSSEARERRVLTAGDRIRTAAKTTLYYIGKDNKRYAFPNMTVSNSWFKDQLDIVKVDQGTLNSYPIGGNVLVRPGTFLIKITSDPRVYAVTPGGIIRVIPTEAIALKLFGKDWKSKVIDIPDGFFVNYQLGSPLTATAHPDGTIISYTGSPLQYLISGGMKRLLTPDGFMANYYQPRFVISNVPTSFVYPTGPSIIGYEAALTTPAGP